MSAATLCLATRVSVGDGVPQSSRGCELPFFNPANHSQPPTKSSCRPFLAGCDDALRQANALRSGGGGSNSGFGNPGVATWVKTAGKNAHEALLAIAQSGGAAALEELRSAAAPFPAVLRALEAVVVEEGSAAAAASTAAAAAASSPSSAAAAAGEAAPPACAACGAAAAPLRCGGCRRARYCGAECQKRDWRAHKAACKQQRR